MTLEEESVLGTWGAVGRASRTRWRWRVRMAVRRERAPSWMKGEVEVGGGEEKGRRADVEAEEAAA